MVQARATGRPGSVLAIVPARAGSKGIPDKNIALCFGRPLIEWTLEAADDAERVTQIIVSTDYQQLIVPGGMQHQAPAICDNAQIESRLDPIIQAHDPELIALLQPTSPVRTGQQIDEAIDQLCREGADSLVSVVPNHFFTWTDMGSEGVHPVADYDFTHRPRRQDRHASYRENGSIYVFTRAHWEWHHNRLGGKVSLYVMPEECGVEVDSPFDLWLAGKILERQHSLVAGGAW